MEPPKDMTIADILGGSQTAQSSAAAAAAAAAAAIGQPAPTPAGTTAQATDEMAKVAASLGVTVAPGTDVKATLAPMLDMLAKSGAAQEQSQQLQQQQQPQYANTPQPVQGLDLQSQQGAPAPAAPATINVADLDLGEASPEIKKAFKALVANQGALQQEAQQARQAAIQASNQVTQQAQQAQVNEQQAIANQAISYLDGLASPEYGVGANRTMAQTLAAEQVMRQTGLIMRGLNQYGQTMPVEQIVSAAIVSTGRDVPKANLVAPTAAGIPPTPVAAGLTAAPVAQTVGTSGPPGSMMADPEYMAGARAILAR